MSAGAEDGAADAHAARLRRLAMRSWRRGMRETDLLLGQFADEQLALMAPADLDLYEALLEENDQDIYGWIVAASGGSGTGPERFRALIGRVADAAAMRLATSAAAVSRSPTGRTGPDPQ